MRLNKKIFLIYKLLNSTFTGLSIGILFTIYQPLEDPSIYSIGGMILAIGMLVLANFYDKILNIKIPTNKRKEDNIINIFLKNLFILFPLYPLIC